MNEQHENHEQFVNKKAFFPIHNSTEQPLRHSRFGIASFVISMVSIISFLILTFVITALVNQFFDWSAIVDENGKRLMAEEEFVNKIQPYIGYLILFPLLLGLVLIGLILGIVALTKPGYKKVFAVLGIILNGLPLLLVLLLMIIGFVTI
ncbi:hypothetical protein [Cohnella sp. WQ 127256]|uniref:hypothetical protein n=1 Tax=Cohnella sp. WQ 127256 TaxID=2938790 RepID=UPI002118E85E|nr:hypothetical protein [Cohnella sp. WQ 127256]